MASASPERVGHKSDSEYKMEDPAMCWIDLVEACREPDQDRRKQLVNKFLFIATNSHWTMTNWVAFNEGYDEARSHWDTLTEGYSSAPEEEDTIKELEELGDWADQVDPDSLYQGGDYTELKKSQG